MVNKNESVCYAERNVFVAGVRKTCSYDRVSHDTRDSTRDVVWLYKVRQSKKGTHVNCVATLGPLNWSFGEKKKHMPLICGRGRSTRRGGLERGGKLKKKDETKRQS